MNRDIYIQYVEHIPMIRELAMSTRDKVAGAIVDVSHRLKIAPGEKLYKKGSEDDNTGVVLLQGRMIVDSNTGTTLEVEGPELLGEMQQFDQLGQRTATVSAKSEALLLEFSWHELIDRLLQDADFTLEHRLELRKIVVKYANERLAELGLDSDAQA